MKRLLFFLIALLLVLGNTEAQNLTQVIRGQVTDKTTQQPLPGANIVLNGSQPPMGTATDNNGYFKLSGVPVGRIGITISFLGYNTVTLTNLYVTSGKEMQLNIELEEKLTSADAVVVTASKPKSRANNEMSTVSARTFTIEETEKYAGSRGDIARMASNYAGVSFANDSRNDIVIRGNSPSGLLWKLEDVEIPNPNHFAENGTTGGPVGMLNNNTLKNSDFFTGAFPAEYGNAMSGVFDLKMRNGNTERYEFTGQSGFNGFELGAEGPLSKNNSSSFMIFYRYSTLELLDKLGVNFGTAGVPKYQDMSFKLNYPVKNGVISAFGIGGKSQIAMLTSKLVKGKDLYSANGQNLYNHASMAAGGVSYAYFMSSKTYLKFQASALYSGGGTNIDTLTWHASDSSYSNATAFLRHNIDEYRATLAFTTGTKFSARCNSKTGMSLDQMGYDLNSTIRAEQNGNTGMFPFLEGRKSLASGPQLLRSFTELSYKLSETFTINPGLQYMYFTLNNSHSLEPRLGVAWTYAPNLTLSAGYGKHARTHALSVYYYVDKKSSTSIETNKNLDFSKANHYVISNDWNISRFLRLKSEIYYQDIYNIPVEQKSSAFSIVNSGANWGLQAPDSLVNKGTGYNYGAEFTLEKFLSSNYYFLLTASLFDSKYRGSDNILRNTAFNGNYVVNTLFGYELPLSTKWSLATDLKVAVGGGKRLTEVDLKNSRKYNEVRYFEAKAFEKQGPKFLKIDIKFGIRNNMAKYSQEWQVYIENVTNHQNLIWETYNNKTGNIDPIYQLGIFPMVLWRINF